MVLYIIFHKYTCKVLVSGKEHFQIHNIHGWKFMLKRRKNLLNFSESINVHWNKLSPRNRTGVKEMDILEIE